MDVKKIAVEIESNSRLMRNIEDFILQTASKEDIQTLENIIKIRKDREKW